MPEVALIINSCKAFYQTTIPRIISSCKDANIPRSNIYVVVGDCDEDIEMQKRDDYNIVFCRYVNIDYNGVIYFTQTKEGLAELEKYSHFFYIHDTCIVLEHFWTTLYTYVNKCETYIKLNDRGSKNIGLLNVKWFIAEKKELFSYYINYDKALQMQYKSGDFPNRDAIYKKYNNLPRWLNEDCIFLCKPQHIPLGDIFSNKPLQYMTHIYSDEQRLATEYRELGLIKFQRNWGGQWKLTL